MTAPNSFNTGRDGYQLTIISATLGKITFNGITSFETKPTVVKLKSVALDGRIRHRTIPDGHTGTIELDRQDASFDTYFAGVEANFFAGLPPDAIFITHTIRRLDESVAVHRHCTDTRRRRDVEGARQGDREDDVRSWPQNSTELIK